MKKYRTTCSMIAGLLCAGMVIVSGCADRPDIQAQSEWVELFNGTDLEGWHMQGEGSFHVEDGVLVGETVLGRGNSFLVTNRAYDDFELVADFQIGPDINSGIQIRSAVYDQETTTAYLSGRLETRERTWPVGRVHGLQVEIDPSARAWTAGLYEEGGRGWLEPLTDNPAAREAFRPGEWNRLRAIAQGSRIQTWINDVPAAELEDSAASSGFIGLQLHGANRPEQEGQTVMFRNIRLRPLSR